MIITFLEKDKKLKNVSTHHTIPYLTGISKEFSQSWPGI
jgi:hypothetical protein